MSKKQKIINASGFRKRAIARAFLKPGNGKVMINKIPLELISPEMSKLKIKEPLMLSEKYADEVDIEVSVRGGGIVSQSDAARLAIARVLNEYSKDKLKKTFLEYDRMLLVADIRRKEASKPNSKGNARAKRQKSYR